MKKDLKERAKELRRQGLTYAVIAKRLNKPVQTVHHWVNKK